jgi:hypothetical protein
MAKQQAINQTDVHDPFPLDRLSDAVEEAIQRVENPDWVGEQRAILERMTTDDRMKNVWTLLLSRKRPSREFAYPARPRDSTGSKSTDEMQLDALCELFYFVFSAVTGCVNRRIDGEACAGEDKGRSRPLDLFNGMAIQGDGLPVASLV